jgi:acetyl esterase/lipase
MPHTIWSDLRKVPRIARTAVASAVGVPALAAAAYTLVSHAVYHRSNVATAAELYLRVTGGGKKMLKDMVLLDNTILQRAEDNDRRYTIPSSVTLNVSVAEEMRFGQQVFHLNRRPINDRVVIYLHGGCFLNRPTPEHWKFLDTLAHRTRAEIIVPLYPLTPMHGALEALDFLTRLYEEVVLHYGASNVTLMGDSCGGGLAASFAEHLAACDMDQPARLILISPWVDATLCNPDIVHFERTDPILGLQGLQKLGITWAKDLDPNDYRVSPVNGEVRQLRNVIVFVGTREVFYPDAHLFYDRVNATGAHAELYVGRGLNHCYPLMPIPEAKWAMERMVELISTD